MYLVESYLPDISVTDLKSAAARASEVSAELRSEGRNVEYEGAILVPVDDVVFHLFTSSSEDTVREASRRAAVSFERVVESVTFQPSSRNRYRPA
jgi:hypothetical protein